jgi:hypothetical protein
MQPEVKTQGFHPARSARLQASCSADEWICAAALVRAQDAIIPRDRYYLPGGPGLSGPGAKPKRSAIWGMRLVVDAC